MALSNSQYDAIMREYGKQQMENQHSQEARKKEVYEKVKNENSNAIVATKDILNILK